MIAVAQLSARVEDIDYHTPRGLDRGLFLKLTVCDFIRERRNHVAHPRPCGVGKSWRACAARAQGLGYGITISAPTKAAQQNVTASASTPRRK
jgi:hypothetical protein